MTTTPTIWKSSFVANAAGTNGYQHAPQTIGLANGNFLVVWEDNANTTRPGADIIGQMFNPQGIAIGGAMQINQGIWGGNETGPQIAALPDGGFVMAYGGYFEALGGFLVVERFNSLGQSVFHNVINDDLGSLTDFWDITADANGNYTLVFERHSPSIDVHSITYDYLSNVAGPERTNLAQNSSAIDRLGAADSFASGHILTFTNEPDYPVTFPYQSAEIAVVNPVTGVRLRNSQIDGGAQYQNALAKDVAVLAGGQFVMVYEFDPSNQIAANTIYAFKVGLGEMGSIGPRVTITTMGGLGGLHVIALQDGGFFIAWLSGNTLHGQRYGAYGDKIGTSLQFATDAINFAVGDLGLTSDGRILVSYKNLSGEIGEVILDPRETTIYGTAASEAITTQTISSIVFGLGGSDTIFGRGGNDRIYGGPAYDRLRGGNGNDSYYLFDTTPTGEHDLVTEDVAGGIDNVHVRPGTDPNILYSYTLPTNVEDGFVDSSDTMDLIGNALNNVLSGGAGQNFIFGMAGNDVLVGFGGGDNLYGGPGNDTLHGGTDGDVLDGDGDNDTASYINSATAVRTSLDGTVVQTNDAVGDSYTEIENLTGTIYGDVLAGDAQANVLRGEAGIDQLYGREGADTLTGGAGADLLHGGNGTDTASYATALAGVNADLGNIVAGLGDALGDTFNLIEQLVGSRFADVLRGDALANLIIGGVGNDIIVGRGGSDTLRGSGGSDTLYGQAGDDSFNYLARSEAGDAIADFSSAVAGDNDRFTFANGAFGALGVGALAADEFQSSAAAVAASSTIRFFYETDTRMLWFDPDGSFATAAIRIATVQIGATVTIADILIV